jgi:hypothetical protein
MGPLPRSAFFALLVAPALFSTDISTGFLLGPKYDQRAFYIRSSPSSEWRKTYSESEYRRQAQGKLMNLRLAQALFDDEWMTEHPFDPEKNTTAVIDALDFYKQHGVLMITVSLQGGNPGYEAGVNGVARQNGFRYGPGKGSSVSAYRPDGSLKPGWMNRLERLVRAADERGMVVGLICFYQSQDELFDTPAAIDRALRGTVDWLIEKNFRNVIIDIANEWDHSGWDFDRYIPQNLLRFIDEVRERFQKRRTDYALPVGASTGGSMLYPESLTEVVDMVLVHGNACKPACKTERVASFKDTVRPVIMTEDDNGRASTTANLANELASCSILFERAAGWGYMPWVQAQRFPFRFLPADSAAVEDAMPEKERDLAYFHAVLEHIAKLTLNRPPHPAKRR